MHLVFAVWLSHQDLSIASVCNIDSSQTSLAFRSVNIGASMRWWARQDLPSRVIRLGPKLRDPIVSFSSRRNLTCHAALQVQVYVGFYRLAEVLSTVSDLDDDVRVAGAELEAFWRDYDDSVVIKAGKWLVIKLP